MNYLILAGGSGTRFWPRSRRQNPKQCLSLYGEKSMLEHTIERIEKHSNKEQRYLVYGPHLQEKLSNYNALSIVEPSARNTAPAIALGALIADHFDPNTAIVVLPSDHFIGDNTAFIHDLNAAEKLAKKGAIVTLGIPPTRPETGYGYIKKGAEIESGFDVEAFVEKPAYSKAVDYLSSGQYLWNAGMFVFTYKKLLTEIKKQLPDMVSGLTKIKELLNSFDAKSWDTVAEQASSTIKEVFNTFEKTSIDFGIMENATKVAVIPASFPWSDLGHWAAMEEVREADADGNILDGPQKIFLHDAKNNIIAADAGKRIAVVGVSDLVIVDTEDALLILPKSRAQEVRKVVEFLEKNEPELL